VTQQIAHWRVAGAAAVFVLAGSSAVALAVHDRAGGTAVAYQSWPKRAAADRELAARPNGAARAGLRLMSQAAAACRNTAFSAVLVSRSWGPAGTRVSMADVWHRPGGQTVAVAQPVSTSGGRDSAASADQSAPSAPILISAQQLALLKSGYVLEYAGPSSADGRPAIMIAVERPDGTLAARYWLDGQTKLPLRRQLFDSHARLVSDMSLTDLRVGPASLGGMPTVRALPTNRQLSQASVMSLRRQGWPLPVELPNQMVLFAASQTGSASGRVIGVSYSDGLSVISLFVQRGALPAHMAGWQRIAVAGHDAYASDSDDQTIAWSSDGYVITVVADAPSTTVDQVVAALAHGQSQDFWTRIGRGFGRLVSWANPFR
jgi:sigma-E factor negative regulatory protein RseB